MLLQMGTQLRTSISILRSCFYKWPSPLLCPTCAASIGKHWYRSRVTYNRINYVKRPILTQTLRKAFNGVYTTQDQNVRHFKSQWTDYLESQQKVETIIERENIYTIPNILCSIRILLSPYIGFLILNTDYETALYGMAFAGITDLFDGMIARKFVGQSSKLGTFLDPLADKILVASVFLSLTYVNLIPVFLTSIIVIRDISLASAAFYIRYKSLPPPKTFSRYFDVSHATAQLAPTFISKVNTLVQLFTVAATLCAPVFDIANHPAVIGLWWLTGCTTVASGMSYVFSKNTYKVLKNVK